MSNTYFKAMSVMGCEIGGITRRSLCHHNCCDGENCVTWLEKQFAKLNEYEEAKADGRLVVLPCKVGDTVYHRSGQHTIDDIQLFYPRQNGHVPEERIGKLQIRLGSLNYAGLQTFATYADEIGKTVFLTREEAEKALGGAEDGK